MVQLLMEMLFIKLLMTIVEGTVEAAFPAAERVV